jgi:hypothetical protein
MDIERSAPGFTAGARAGRSTAVTITMLPTTKVELEALSTLFQIPASRVVDQAITALMNSLGPEDRSAVERLVARAVEKAGETAAEATRAPVRMPSTEGMFELSRAAHHVHGRAGTTKAGILKAIQEIKRPFSYQEFYKAVSKAMRYESASNRFGIPTRFGSIDEAVRAWFNELKNKQKLIIPCHE